jgi:hypothetical protein
MTETAPDVYPQDDDSIPDVDLPDDAWQSDAECPQLEVSP